MTRYRVTLYDRTFGDDVRIQFVFMAETAEQAVDMAKLHLYAFGTVPEALEVCSVTEISE